MLQSITHTTILFSLAAERAKTGDSAFKSTTYFLLLVCIMNTDYDGCMSKKVNVNATML